MDKKEFKVGQQWETRGGDVLTIMQIADGGAYPINTDNGWDYTAEGRYWSDDARAGDPAKETDSGDLIELVQDVADFSEPAIPDTEIARTAPLFPAWTQPVAQPWGGIVPPPSPAPMPPPQVTTQATEPAIPNTEIARTIAQFISSKELALNTATDQRERLERQLADAVARESALCNEIGQAKTALAALK